MNLLRVRLVYSELCAIKIETTINYYGCYVMRSYIGAATAEAVGILRGVINSYRSN